MTRRSGSGPRPDRRLPQSRLDVRVHAGRVEVYEHYSEEASQKLVETLRCLGVRARRRFGSPCG